MSQPFAAKPFPIPVVAAGPGAHTEDETLDYLHMPQGMSTFRAPPLPEPEELAGHEGAVAVLQQVLSAAQALVRGEAVAPVAVQGLDAANLTLLNQLLGEGEVSAQVLAQPGDPRALQPGEAAPRVRVSVQESVFAGIWRVVTTADDGAVSDTIEVATVPAVLKQATREDLPFTPAKLQPPPSVQNAPMVLVELADHRQHWRPGDRPQVVNLTLLPLTVEDISFMDAQLGTGRVLILSRGYGNCRITNCCVANTWRVVYYNSQDTVILNSVEVTDMPEVACAAQEDLVDSTERLAEVLAWVRQG